MKHYLIAFNNLQGFGLDHIHRVVTNVPQISDWWHYLPGTYLICTSLSSKSIADFINQYLPGLLFLVLEVDYKQFNGVLSKDAWEWINQKRPYPVQVNPVSSKITTPFFTRVSMKQPNTSHQLSPIDSLWKNRK